MYGLILDSLSESLRRSFGEEIWRSICGRAELTQACFLQKRRYSETMFPRLLKAAVEISGQDEENILETAGRFFVHHLSHYGYDRLMRVLGRRLRDFLQGLDNLHGYMQFTYPKMKAPSFFCEEETSTGLTLKYRSKRRGYLQYVIGQIHAVGLYFYETPVSIDVISHEESITMTHVTMKIHFNNTSFVKPEVAHKGDSAPGVPDLLDIPLDYDVLRHVFPFHMVFSRHLVITGIGSGLERVMPHSTGEAVDEIFTISKPLVEFTFENIITFSNNVFELLSIDFIQRATGECGETISVSVSTLESDDIYSMCHRLRLKGQMVFMEEWDCVFYIGTPIIDNLETLFQSGMFINDLSMHDWSRDLVLVGTQQQTELKMAIEQEKEKSKRLETGMKEVDKELQRTDALLYQMIPRTVADRLRHGEAAVNTCQTFDSVTILFTDVVGFTYICSHISPMAVVEMLNDMYTKFDQLTEKHCVYKVETIGDAYMIVSGAPTVTKFHAIYITDMGFDLIEAIQTMKDPSADGNSSIKIRVGIHTGPVVGGIVGVKMPRYCLVGETVHIANMMESSGKPMKVHISESTKQELKSHPYICDQADSLQIKGRPPLVTYWCNGKSTPEHVTRKGYVRNMSKV